MCVILSSTCATVVALPNLDSVGVTEVFLVSVLMEPMISHYMCCTYFGQALICRMSFVSRKNTYAYVCCETSYYKCVLQNHLYDHFDQTT